MARKMVLAICCVLLCLSTAAAHPGGTDAEGGHYDRSTGEYHYHHGYPAHQHIDGECLYRFVDNTDETPGAYGDEDKVAETMSQASKNSADRETFWYAVSGCLILFLLGGVVFFLDRLVQMRRQRRKLLPLYQGKSISKLAGVPDWAEVDFRGNPHTKGAANTPEDAFVVYAAGSVRIYHRGRCRCLGNPVHPMNIRDAKQKGLTPCLVCSPLKDVPEWAVEYRKIDMLRKRYNIPMDP